MPKDGNKNALKHGLWAKRDKYSEEELSKQRIDVLTELRALRVVFENLNAKVDSIPNAKDELNKFYNNLDRLLATFDRIDTAVHTQHFLTGGTSEAQKDIDAGVTLARIDLKIPNYFNAPIKRIAKKSARS